MPLAQFIENVFFCEFLRFLVRAKPWKTDAKLGGERGGAKEGRSGGQGDGFVGMPAHRSLGLGIDGEDLFDHIVEVMDSQGRAVDGIEVKYLPLPTKGGGLFH